MNDETSSQPTLSAIDLDYHIDLLKKCGYVVLPSDRYFSMMLYCATHNICGFTLLGNEDTEEQLNGRIH